MPAGYPNLLCGSILMMWSQRRPFSKDSRSLADRVFPTRWDSFHTQYFAQSYSWIPGTIKFMVIRILGSLGNTVTNAQP